MLNFKDWLVIKEAAPVAGQPAAAVPAVQKPSVPTNPPTTGKGETQAQQNDRLKRQALEAQNAAKAFKAAQDAMQKLSTATLAGVGAT